MMRIASTLTRLLPIALALGIAGCRDTSHVLAVVLAVKGGVTQVGTASRDVAPGDLLAAPATIRTAANSAVVVATLPGVLIRVEDAAEITIEQLELHKRVDEMGARKARLQLREGRMLVWVDEFRHGSIEVVTRTPAGDLKFNGPGFAEIAPGVDGSVRVLCIGGSLSAAGTSLLAGEWTTLSPGLIRSTAQIAADTDDVWRALLRAREIEPQLLDLQARQRERTPIRGINPTGSATKN